MTSSYAQVSSKPWKRDNLHFSRWGRGFTIHEIIVTIDTFTPGQHFIYWRLLQTHNMP